MRSLRITLVCRIGWPSRGGMERVVQGLGEALQGRGHRVDVVTLDRSVADGAPLPAGALRGLRYRRLRRMGPRRYPFALGLRRAVAGADLVHVHGVDGLLDTVAWGGGPPVGVSTHGAYLHTPRHRRLKQLWLRTGTAATLGRVAVWYTSEADRAAVGAPGEVIENGTDLGALLRVRRTPEAGLWVVPGRVVPHKGHAEVLALVARLPPARRPARIVAVGACPDPAFAEALDRRAERLGVPWERTGAVTDPVWRAWLGRAAQAVLPSRAEGFGLALLEAMAADCPVVARDLPSHRRLLGGPGSALREPEDLLHPVRGLRPRARRWDWSARVEAFEAAYAALVHR